jgi:hypothetical protein
MDISRTAPRRFRRAAARERGPFNPKRFVVHHVVGEGDVACHQSDMACHPRRRILGHAATGNEFASAQAHFFAFAVGGSVRIGWRFMLSIGRRRVFLICPAYACDLISTTERCCGATGVSPPPVGSWPTYYPHSLGSSPATETTFASVADLAGALRRAGAAHGNMRSERRAVRRELGGLVRR